MMDKYLVTPNTTLKKTMAVIDASGKRLSVVVGKDNKFLGIISDGDIRRALLGDYDLSSDISSIYQRNPLCLKKGDFEDDIYAIAKSRDITYVPYIDHHGYFIKLINIDLMYHPNRVVLMVGGLGERLRPLTETTPKPLLKVGDRPILETIIRHLLKHKFKKFTLCVNYKADMIADYFADGSRLGVEISYVRENKRLGTAGALSLLNEEIEDPLIVMNGDILTGLDFSGMLKNHLQKQAVATVGVKEHEIQVPYGVVESEGEIISKLTEKPKHKFHINSGVYIINPELLKLVPTDTFFDMPTLIQLAMSDNKKVIKHSINGYWLDIGSPEDYLKANNSFHEIFD